MLKAIAVNKPDGEYKGPMETPAALIAEGDPQSESWQSYEFAASGKATMGVWSGQPGKINIPAYPVNELMTVISGKLEVTNEDGTVMSFEPGESFFIPKGWKGVWHVVVPSEKCYFIIE